MQSEIDDIRMALSGLGILRDMARLDAAEVDSFIGFVSARLDLIEAQQGGAPAMLPVLRLGDLVARRPRPVLRVIDADRPQMPGAKE